MTATLHHMPGHHECRNERGARLCSGHPTATEAPSPVSDWDARVALLERLYRCPEGFTPPPAFWSALASHLEVGVSPRDKAAATVRLIETLNEVLPT